MNVELVCIKVQSKLRVRITSPGYLNDANCQFPRDLRVEGRRFQVPAVYVTLVQSRGKQFYSIPRGVAEIVCDKKPTKVFEDQTVSDCAICLNEPKEMVFVPCGHYYCCASCTKLMKNCPICRQIIANSIAKSALLE